MTRAAGIFIAVVLASLASARDKAPTPAKPAAPAPRGIVRTTVGRGEVMDAHLDGKLVAWTHLREANGSRQVLVLLAAASVKPVTATDPAASKAGTNATATPAPEACKAVDEHDSDEKLRRLVRLDPRGEGGIVELRADIPADTEALSPIDSDSDGRDELLLFRTGRVEALAAGDDGRFRGDRLILVDDPDIGGAASSGLGYEKDSVGPRLRLPVVGALRTWAPDPPRTRWRTVSDSPTPFDAEPSEQGLYLVGPRILACGRDASGRARFATEAEAVGRDRLRARLLDPEAAPEARSLTCWAKLPSPERLIDQACVMLDGAPHLVVTTMSAEKMSFFGEKRLRLFPLSPDRSRMGTAARFAVTTGLNLWQSTTPELADVSGDGRADLVLAYWKGLKDSIVVLEVYLAKSDGGFETSARRTEIDVKDGEKSWIGWGDDANGDGHADLLVFADKKLLLLPGASASDGRKLAASKPSASLPWPADAPDLGSVWAGAGPEGAAGGVDFGSLGVPTVIDLDGDHRVEVVLAGNDDAGGRVLVFSFAAP